jgi:putative DNA primase/helicase
VACGKESGVFVVDIDPRHDGFQSIADYQQTAGELPQTLTALTGGGGRHLFFAYPEDSTVGNRTGWIQGVDVKSDGGYVILAPSVHKSGVRYDWQNWADPDDEPMIALPPESLVLSITQKGTTRDSDFDVPDDEQFLQGVPEGERNETIFRWACSFRRRYGDGSKSLCWLAIQQAAASCSPPYPEDEARRCLESAWEQDHSDEERPLRMLGIGAGELHDRSDLGNAKRLADTYGQDVKYVVGWGWMMWDSIKWNVVNVNEINTLCQEIPRIIREEADTIEGDRRARLQHVTFGIKSQNSGPLGNIEKLARALPELKAYVEDFDADDMVLGCRNGVVDLRTGELRAATRDDLASKNTDVTYDQGVDQSQWLSFLAEALDNDQDVIEYVQRAAGYSLTGSTREECFFMISGPPASGKSSFLDALGSAMGSYSTVTQSDTFMYQGRGHQPDKNEIARLAGVRLLTMSEIREGESFNEALIKQFTGGDSVAARFIYEKGFTFRPQLKLWIGTNHDPAAKDDAMWRRIRKIAFPVTVPEEKRDRRLKDYLRNKEEGAMAVLAWAVQGAMKWNEVGLGEPQKITQTTMAYRQIQDRDQAFILDVLEDDIGALIGINEVYVAYRQWCDRYGDRARTQNVFINMMIRKGFHVELEVGGFTIHDIRIKTAYVGTQGMGINLD